MAIHNRHLVAGIVVNSIIGEGTKFRGDFELNGLLRIDGAFEGKIESEGKVLVGRHGSAVAPTIRARTGREVAPIAAFPPLYTGC